MIRVVIIGGGNLAFHLTKALQEAAHVDLVQVYNRSIEKIAYLTDQIAITDNLEALKDADLYIISVSDTAISTISKKLTRKNSLIVHTSGSVSIEVLHLNKRSGIFYPLQTFSKARNVDFKSIPFCLEASNKDDLALLESLANALSDKVYFINSTQRKQIHVAAVFVNNFTNHLYQISNNICEVHGITPALLHPLLLETAKKALEIPAIEAQTGPARRGDIEIINKHLSILSDNNKEIYKLLSKSIAQTYGKKL